MQSDKLPSSTVLDEFVTHFEASVAPWCNNVTIGHPCSRGDQLPHQCATEELKCATGRMLQKFFFSAKLKC